MYWTTYAISIETTDLTKHYGSLKAVDALNLKSKKGEIFGFSDQTARGNHRNFHALHSAETDIRHGFDKRL